MRTSSLAATLALTALALQGGCTAIKATVPMAQVEDAWGDAREADAEARALYEYTLAEQYRLKAREEWGYSDYGDAEELARKALDYCRQAEEMALYGATDDDAQRRHEILENLEETEDFVPEEINRQSAPDEDEEDFEWDE
ncbi:MAG: hypothetical protein H6739_33270 [Alphaproteobacteria bacterium]|nr:hypothetical protein [Alphaproteobacteria bacterium]